MKSAIKIMITFLLVGIVHSVQAQKKPYYNEQEQVIEAAYKALDNEMKSGKLTEWATEYGMKGSYTFNITIGGKKGAVYTVNTIERSIEDAIKEQNALKNYVKAMRFPFKMPKDKSYQFPYEFKF